MDLHSDIQRRVDKQGLLRWSHVESELGHRREDAELLEQIARL